MRLNLLYKNKLKGFKYALYLVRKFSINALNLVQNGRKFAQGRMQSSNISVRIRKSGRFISKTFKR